MSANAIPEHLDVLIVGAGISGIDAAYHLKTRLPKKSWLILEARDRIGGTWDLFRYPGVRSDSDMYTLGFPFRPWRGEQAIVEGEAIRAYVEDTAHAYGIDERIRFNHKVVRASWSSEEARWMVETESGARFTAAFLFMGSGYYDYERGYRPAWPGERDFAGPILHPQFWPEDFDPAGKRIAVIGSGATAVTLVPALAQTAAHVTMVQRSPSYVVARPSRDKLARRIGPGLARWKNVLLGLFFFSRARKRPRAVRALLIRMAAAELPPGYAVRTHFLPRYNPWDQRLCLVPDGDLFAAIREGRASVATGEIERFTSEGLRLASGETVDADAIVTATGLVVKLLGGVALEVDGAPVNVADRFNYKGMMLNDVPNLILFFGYTNASWTLKCDLTARYACRLMCHMDRRGYAICTPRLREPPERLPMLDFSSGYVQRAAASLPAQGPEAPWRVHQNYLKDLAAMRFRSVADGVMEFARRG
ncbi:MAG: flavin-containing monooxygenase [Sphingosinicella sp.]|uniref:flavin-containing monooxygenase n=1 Tax=Sphingosinicella sp. TaxID=1917971 RepID=UPI0040380B7A